MYMSKASLARQHGDHGEQGRHDGEMGIKNKHVGVRRTVGISRGVQLGEPHRALASLNVVAAVGDAPPAPRVREAHGADRNIVVPSVLLAAVSVGLELRLAGGLTGRGALQYRGQGEHVAVG